MKNTIKIIGLSLCFMFFLSACNNESNNIEDPNNNVHSEEVDDGNYAFKPVIYLYPEEETQVQVKLDYQGELTFTYPPYNKGWEVIAKPDGTLINSSNQREYSYLFWEGNHKKEWKIDEGFVIKGEDTTEFLQEKLAYLGLSPKEYNEFIVFWAPRMENNPYNLIYFAEEEYEELAPLHVNPKPDSVLRVFMVFEGLSQPIEIAEQKLNNFQRRGFSVIEWGGTELQ